MHRPRSPLVAAGNMGMTMFLKMAASTAALVLATASAAQTLPDPAAPAPAAPTVTPICTDRPTKASTVCTVPAGSIQIESDIVNWTRTTVPGAQADVVLYTNPTIKYGLGATTDIEANIAPYETVRTRVGGVVDQEGGVGDLYVKLKQQLTNSSSKTQFALIPYIKVPTARIGIGNGKVEGGLIAPLVFTLPRGFTLNFSPEVDVLLNSTDDDRHAQLVGIANLAKGVGKATFSAELWTAQNVDPAGTVRQYSADVAVAYLLAPTLQVDVGGNIGLNRATPDAQVYVGLSKRF